MAQTSRSEFPQQVELDVAMLRAYPNLSGMYTATTQLASWIAQGGISDAAQAERLKDVRAALGNGATAQESFATLLTVGQAPAADISATGRLSKSLHGAFAHCVADGTFTTNDARALVRYESSRVSPNAIEEPIGTEHSGLTIFSSRLSSYVDALGHDDRSEAFRDAFVSESLKGAQAARSSAMSTALYAQAANVLGDASPDRIMRTLTGISGADGQGIAHFAVGATAGAAERAKPVDFLTANGHVEFRCDGIAHVISKLNAASAATGGVENSVLAKEQTAVLFTGVSAFLTASRGSELDRNLSAFDSRTGLREALNGAMRANFPAIFTLNARQNGEGLIAPGSGFDTISSYARFQFGAPNDGHGRRTAAEAERVLGLVFGTLHGDILKSSRDAGAELRRDFGAGTFGDRAHDQHNAARVLGELLGATRNGINQDFTLRADRAGDEQKALQDSFERAATIVGLASKVAGERAGPILEGLTDGLDELSKATPLQVTDPTGLGITFDTLERRFGTDLAKYRPNRDLANTFDDGRSVANSEWANFANERAYRKAHDGALDSQKGLLAQLLMKTIVAAPETPADPKPTSKLAENELFRHTERVVITYNAAHPDAKLPLPIAGRVSPWNGQPVTGVALEIAPNEYAIHRGRGSFEVFSREQTRGVEPPLERPIELERDGTVYELHRPSRALTR